MRWLIIEGKFLKGFWFLFAEKQEKEVDIYASLSDEKAFVFSVALAEINRKILGQRLILWTQLLLFASITVIWRKLDFGLGFRKEIPGP